MQKGEGTRNREMLVGWEQSARNLGENRLPGHATCALRAWGSAGPRAWLTALPSPC